MTYSTNFRKLQPFSRLRPVTVDHSLTISDRCEAIRTSWGYSGSVTPEEMGYDTASWKKLSKMSKENARHAYWARLAAYSTEDITITAKAEEYKLQLV